MNGLTMFKFIKVACSPTECTVNVWQYAFAANSTGLPVYLVCHEHLSNNKKSNIERHYMNKHDTFAKANQAGDDRKR